MQKLFCPRFLYRRHRIPFDHPSSSFFCIRASTGIGSGSSITQIEANTVYISDPTINTSSQYNVNFSIGTKVPTSYSVKVYDNRDIYDTYDSNDEFEEAADDIIDFRESNPFGTVASSTDLTI